MSDEIQSQLQAYCVRAFPSRQGVQVNGLASVSAGWESDVYSFDVEHGPPEARQREGLILRIYPGDDAHAKSAREFRGMHHLHEAGYPVPRVLLLEREDSPFGRPFVIMERIAGRVLWPILFNAPERRQQELLTQFCELFVRLHRLDWRPFVDDVARYELGGPTAFADQWLRRVRGAVERFPLSNSLRILEWLEARRDQVPCLRPAPVHGDYHPANVLLRDDGSAVVLDAAGEFVRGRRVARPHPGGIRTVGRGQGGADGVVRGVRVWQARVQRRHLPVGGRGEGGDASRRSGDDEAADVGARAGV
jgi:aminoglycoside phosphotransferase (APT) family kinase protein